MQDSESVADQLKADGSEADKTSEEERMISIGKRVSLLIYKMIVLVWYSF